MYRIFKALEWTLAVLASMALLVMMVLTFVDVIGRYGFNRSIFGTAEMVEYLMVVVIFAGIAFITCADQHIKVEILEPWIKRRVPNMQRWVVLLFSLAVYAFVAYQLTKHAVDSFASGKRTAVLDGPQWYMPGAAALFSIIGVALFLTAILSTRGHPAEMGHLDHLSGDPDADEHLEL